MIITANKSEDYPDASKDLSMGSKPAAKYLKVSYDRRHDKLRRVDQTLDVQLPSSGSCMHDQDQRRWSSSSRLYCYCL